MNDDLNQSLLEALKQTLPEMQVKAVEERLKEYNGLKKKLNESEQLVKYYGQTLTEKDNEIEKLHTECDGLSESLGLFEKREEQLKARELDCEAKERNWEMERLQIKLEASQELNQNMFNLTSQVFQSPVYQSTQSGMMTVRNGYNGYDQIPFNQISRVEVVPPAGHKHCMDGNNSTKTQGCTGNVMP